MGNDNLGRGESEQHSGVFSAHIVTERLHLICVVLPHLSSSEPAVEGPLW